MPSSPRFPSNPVPPETDWTETLDSRAFPSTRFEGAANWTEARDLKLVARAAPSGGVVTTADLRTCGFSADSTRSAVRRGLLTRWGRGIYLVGPLSDDFTQARAAAAAGGVLGFGVAAQLAKIGPVARPPVDVIVSRDRHGSRAGVRVHRIDLTAPDVTRMEGLSVTAPAV